MNSGFDFKEYLAEGWMFSSSDNSEDFTSELDFLHKAFSRIQKKENTIPESKKKIFRRILNDLHTSIEDLEYLNSSKSEDPYNPYD